MDEIELLRRVRANQLEPSQKTVDAAREALLERAAHESQARSKNSSKKRLLRPRSRALWGVGVVMLSGAAASALIISVALQNTQPMPVAGSTSAPLSETLVNLTGPELLRLAAEKTLEAGDEQLLPGQYLKVDSRVSDARSAAAETEHPSLILTYSESVYIPEDKTAEWVSMRTHEKYEAYTDAAAESMPPSGGQEISPEYERAPRGEFQASEGVGFDLLTLDWASEPQDLLEQIYERNGVNVGEDLGAFSTVIDLQRPGYVSATDRAALLEAAALIPSIETQVAAVDLDGRSGVAISITGDETGAIATYQLVLDSATLLPIGNTLSVDGDGSVIRMDQTRSFTHEVVATAPEAN